MLVERVGVNLDLDPLSTAGNYRQHRRSRRDHPHVVLELRHVLLGRRLFRESPGQHEFGFKYCARLFDDPIQGSGHPSVDGMSYVLLDVVDRHPAVALIPSAVQLLCDDAELDDKVAGQILGFALTAFLSPQTHQVSLIVSHDDACIRATDKLPSVGGLEFIELAWLGTTTGLN